MTWNWKLTFVVALKEAVQHTEVHVWPLEDFQTQGILSDPACSSAASV